MSALTKGIKNAVTRSPRKTVILLSYFIVGLFVSVNWGFGVVFLLAVLALTLLIILLNLSDCVAIMGNIKYGRGQAEQAVPYFKWAIAHKTKSPSAHLFYATCLIRKGLAAEAEPLLNKAAELDPPVITTKNIRLTQASCQWALGNVDGAIEILERMQRNYDYLNASVLSTMGYMYFLKGDFIKAEEYTQKALTDSPDSHAAWDNLGQIRYKQGNLREAKDAFEKAASFKGNLPDSLYYLGLIAEDEGDADKAREYYRKASECEITPLNTVTREQINERLEWLCSTSPRN